MFDIRSKLARTCEDTLQGTFGITSKVVFDIPVQKGRGDLTSTIALQVAKQLSKSPLEIAETLSEALSSVGGVASSDVAGPGYINILLTSDVLFKGLQNAWDACEAEDVNAKDPPIIIEYSQPNIAKPLGIHHIVGTAIGQAISNLYRFTGKNVLRWNYLGDWGTQFGKLAVAVEKWGKKKQASEYSIDELLALYVKFHEELEKDSSLEDAGREAFRKLEEGDTALHSFWEDVNVTTKRSLTALYERLHVSFDLDLGESFYQDKMEPIIQEGIQSGVFHEGEGGALIAEFPEETKIPPFMVRRSDGATLYATRDLAQMKYRIETYEPEAIYILTDVAQKLYFQQLEATCHQLNWQLPTFENVLFGRMRFADKSMSTRKGTAIKLEELLDEAVNRADSLIEKKASDVTGKERDELKEMMGVGAVVYGILSQSRKMDIVFDWAKALTFEGNSAPYIQYTHARSRSVLRKAEVKTIDVAPFGNAKAFGEISQSERVLIRELLRFRDVIQTACSEKMPHKLANYLYELCQAYNAFYGAEPILQAAPKERLLRLALTSLTARTVKCGAALLTLRVPERM